MKAYQIWANEHSSSQEFEEEEEEEEKTKKKKQLNTIWSPDSYKVAFTF